jgi:hypothetical protein
MIGHKRADKPCAFVELSGMVSLSRMGSSKRMLSGKGTPWRPRPSDHDPTKPGTVP